MYAFIRFFFIFVMAMFRFTRKNHAPHISGCQRNKLVDMPCRKNWDYLIFIIIVSKKYALISILKHHYTTFVRPL